MRLLMLFVTSLILTIGYPLYASVPSHALVRANPIGIEQSDHYLRSHAVAGTHGQKLRQATLLSSTVAVGCASSSSLPVEIVNLAASLKCNVDLIYEYVHNNIEYEAIFGSNKGALGTLIDQRGSDLDQSQLFVALLRSSGYSAAQISFQYGYIRLTGAQASNWLGGVDNAYGIKNLFVQGGIPVPVAQWVVGAGSVLTRIDVAHVWVSVNISGTNYVFDPSYKQHATKSTSPGIRTYMGYTKSQFLIDAGGSIAGSSISNINRPKLRENLSRYANNLIDAFRTTPATSVTDLIGGKVIAPLIGSPVRQAALPYISPVQPSGFPQSWGASVPNAYRTCLAISMPGVAPPVTPSGPPQPCANATASTVVLFADEAYPSRVTITSVASSGNFVPTLLVDGGTPGGQTTGTAAPLGSPWTLNIGIQHPYADPTLAPFTNQQGDVSLAAGGAYLVNAGWGEVGRGMVERHRSLLSKAQQAGYPGSSEIVLGESLAVVGASWLAERDAWDRAAGDMSGIYAFYHHGVGIVGQTALVAGSQGPYVDLPFNAMVAVAQAPSTTSSYPPEQDALYAASGSFSSALESAVLEQTQNSVPGMKASSTTRVTDEYAATGGATYLADGTTSAGLTNYFSTILPSLTGYSSADLAVIANAVSTNGTSTGSPAGNWVLLPRNGSVAVGIWQGAGYTVIQQLCDITPCRLGSVRYLISGGYAGGFFGTSVLTPQLVLSTYLQMSSVAGDYLIPPSLVDLGYALANVKLFEPVDEVSGSYLYDHDDLRLGSAADPYSLTLSRHYVSGYNDLDRGFGKGWTTNYDISLARTSEPFSALGDRATTGTTLNMSSLRAGSGEGSMAMAASAIVAMRVTQDLLNGSPTVQSLTIAWMAQRWLSDQLTNNAVVLSEGPVQQQFIAYPRGDAGLPVPYVAPLGSSSTLIGSAPDAWGVPTEFVGTQKDQTVLNFYPFGTAAGGRARSWITPFGVQTTFSYDGSGKLTTVENNVGRKLQLSYLGGHIARVDDLSGRSTNYYYDAANNMTQFQDALGNSTIYSYDISGIYDTLGRLTQVFYPSNPSIPFVTNWYDPIGRVLKQADAKGKISQFYLSGSRSESVDALGYRQVAYQTASGRTLKRAIVLSGLADVFSDTPQLNNVVNVTYREYDSQGRLAISTQPEGGKTIFSYSPDSMHNIVQVARTAKPGSPLGLLTTSSTYEPIFNKPATITDARGIVAQNYYDARTGNLLIAIADAGTGSHLNATTRYQYDSHGLMTSKIDPVGSETRYFYDTSANETSVVADFGGNAPATTTTTYDVVGNAVAVVDPRGMKATTAYDFNRQVVTVKVLGGAQFVKTSYFYDRDGNKIQVTRAADAGNISTERFAYTLTQKIMTSTDPNGGITSFAYDNDDRQIKVVDPVGNITAIAYDAPGRVIARYNPAIQAGPIEATTYTPDGSVGSRSDATHPATTYTYDGFDRLTTATYPNSSTENFTYDVDGNRMSQQNRRGDVTTFSYDTLNRLISKMPPSPEPTVSYSYDLAGRMIGASDSGATLPAVTTNAQYAVTYVYDALNRLVSSSWSPTPVLAAAAASSVNFTYRYDGASRRISEVASDNSWMRYPSGPPSTTYASNNLNQYTSITTIGSAGLTYDGNGNVGFDGLLSYAYDSQSKLTLIGRGATTVGTYAYDAQGRRKTKSVGGVITTFVTDAEDREVLEYDGSTGTVKQWYAYGLGPNDVLNRTNVAAGTRATPIPDVLGSIIGELQTASSLAKSGYSSFGERTPSAGETFRYTGSRLDWESGAYASQPSGLYYMRARMYSPTLGRFLQADPVGYDAGINLYAYVANSPLNATDPSGKACITLALYGSFCFYDSVILPPGNTQISLTQALQANELLSAISQAVTDLRSHPYVTATVGSYSAGTYTNPSFTITAGQIADALTYRELDYYAGKTDSNNLIATGGNPFTIGVASSLYGSSLARLSAQQQMIAIVHDGIHGSEQEFSSVPGAQFIGSGAANQNHQVPYNKAAAALLGIKK